MNRTILMAACLLAAETCTAAGLFGGPTEPGQIPSRFVRVEVLDVGAVPWSRFTGKDGGLAPALSGRLAKVTVVLARFRIGAAFAEWYTTFDDWGGDMRFPLHVGYTLYSAPRRTWLLWSAVPEVYFEASGSLLTEGSSLACRLGPGVRAALCCDADYYGLGVRFEAGWVDIHRDLALTPRVSFLYAGLQLRFLTFGIGF